MTRRQSPTTTPPTEDTEGSSYANPATIPDEIKTPPIGAIVTRVGNMTRDWEMRYSASGVGYAWCSLAVNGWGARKGEVTFYNLTAFSTLAENLVQSTITGDRIIVQGRGSIRTWEREDGTIGRSREILVNDAGPELRFAVATVSKTSSDTSRPSRPADEAEEEPF